MAKLCTFFGVLALSLSAEAALSDYEKGLCEGLSYRAEEICVELVCGASDRAAVRDCRRSGAMGQVMGQCHKAMLGDVLGDYTKRSGASLSCQGFAYGPKF